MTPRTVGKTMRVGRSAALNTATSSVLVFRSHTLVTFSFLQYLWPEKHLRLTSGSQYTGQAPENKRYSSCKTKCFTFTLFIIHVYNKAKYFNLSFLNPPNLTFGILKNKTSVGVR